MTEQHPITPPPELRLQWKQEWLDVRPSLTNYAEWMLAKTARWGYEQRAAVNEAELQKARDEELEACCALLLEQGAWPWPEEVARIRAARRPKPKSLSESALETLEKVSKDPYPCTHQDDADWDTILRALKRLQELEGEQ